MDAADLLAGLVRLVRRSSSSRLVLGIDGPDAAGKTTLADRLATRLRAVTTHEVLRCSVDDFHAPVEVRHRRRALSPEGYYRDTFDYAALRAEVLEPFRTRRARTPCVLLVDGVFLHRPELREEWDLSVYLDVSEPEVLARAVQRDVERFGSEADVRRRYALKYLPGQRVYRAESRPLEAADVVVGHEDPDRPVVVRWDRTQPTSE